MNSIVKSKIKQILRDSPTKDLRMSFVSIMKQHRLVVFIVLAYLFTSLCCIPAGFLSIWKG